MKIKRLKRRLLREKGAFCMCGRFKNHLTKNGKYMILTESAEKVKSGKRFSI